MKWISVKDKLPEENICVLMLIDEKMFVGYYVQSSKAGAHSPDIVPYFDMLCEPCCHHDYPDMKDRERISHWMPLPELPERNLVL